MKVKLKNNIINLSKNDFVGSGGEGSIYVNNGLAFKIYSNPAHMIPSAKIQELSVLDNPLIIKPIDTVASGGTVVGYTMKFVKSDCLLCQLFTRSFRERNNVSPASVLGLVKILRELVEYVHKHKILIVDLNEMNFMVGNNFDTLFAIDVDSWQTPHFPAAAIMESIRDRHSKTFSELTDWFSFGIVTFQMFAGIHPYKGKHPLVKTWDERMEKNISVFHKDVSIPRSCYPLSSIPQVYLDWYKAVFEDGKRLPPPVDFQAPVVQVLSATRAAVSSLFDISKICSFSGNILHAVVFNNNIYATTDDRRFHSRNKSIDIAPGGCTTFSNNGDAVYAYAADGMLAVVDVVKEKIARSSMGIDKIFQYGNRVYAKNGNSIYETTILNVGSKMIMSFAKVLNTVTAVQVFDGVVVQNMLGSCCVSVFPEPGRSYTIRVPQLDGCKIIDAKFHKGVCFIGCENKSRRDIVVLKFSSGYDTYAFDTIKDARYIDLNFTVLDTGVCVSINSEEDIELFSSSHASSSAKILQNPAVGSNMRLFSDGSRLMFADGCSIYSISIKPGQ